MHCRVHPYAVYLKLITDAGGNKMKVIALNGSPRRSRGTTMLILEQFLRGLHQSNAKVELIHLVDLNIEPCTGCFDCWYKTPGKCPINDDMPMLLNKMSKADLWVFSTGVYWDGPSGLLKNTMDRMLPLLEPFMRITNGRWNNKIRKGTMPGELVLVSSCAYWGNDNFDTLLTQMKSFCDRINRKFIGALLRPHSFALPHLMWMGKDTLHILDAARKAGEQLAQKGKMSKELEETVQSSLMPERVYIRHINEESKLFIKRATEGEVEASDDGIEIETTASPFKFSTSRNKILNQQIVDAINYMGGMGDNAEEEYQSSLKTLKPAAKEVVRVISSEYKVLPETSYLDRWSLVYLMGELQESSALPMLGKILSTQIPKEKSKVLHEYSTRAEELMIRTTAVEAIKRIAESKDQKALDILLKLTNHKEFSVRRAAVQSYLEVGGRDARKELMETLSEENRQLLEIHRVDVRKIPQPVILDSTEPKRAKSKPLPKRIEEVPINDRKSEDDTPKPETSSTNKQKTRGDTPSSN